MAIEMHPAMAQLFGTSDSSVSVCVFAFMHVCLLSLFVSVCVFGVCLHVFLHVRACACVCVCMYLGVCVYI